MQVRDRQRPADVAGPSGARSPRRGSDRGRSARMLLVGAGALGVLAVVAMIVTSRGESGTRSARNHSVVEAEASDTEPTRLGKAVRWIDGLAAGLILPSEIGSRLAEQDPGAAKIVAAAWSDLSPSAPAELRRAVRWIKGLAAGLILPSEVSTRLASQDPGLAKTVIAAWSDLDPTDRGAIWRRAA